MQATATVKKQEQASSSETHETAARLGALFRYVLLFDQGEHLQAIEDSGLTMTQIKSLLVLRNEGAPRPVSDLAETLGLSVAAVSRAVEGLVKKRLVTRVEDEQDRRVRRLATTQKGADLANELIATRLAGLEAFASTLTAAQRRKLDAALEALLDRKEIAAAYEQLKKVRA